jgi:hypothetical protein
VVIINYKLFKYKYYITASCLSCTSLSYSLLPLVFHVVGSEVLSAALPELGLEAFLSAVPWNIDALAVILVLQLEVDRGDVDDTPLLIFATIAGLEGHWSTISLSSSTDAEASLFMLPLFGLHQLPNITAIGLAVLEHDGSTCFVSTDTKASVVNVL